MLFRCGAQDSDASDDSEDERRHRRYRHSSDSDSEDDERRRAEEDKPRTPIDFETFQTIVIGRNSLEKIVHDAFFEVPPSSSPPSAKMSLEIAKICPK